MTWILNTPAFSRQALCNLRKPISRGLKWYGELAPTIVKHAITGLKTLISLYEDTSVAYKDNATEALRYCLVIMEKHSELPSLLEIEDDEARSEFLQKLKVLWTDKEIFSIETLTKLLDEDKKDSNTVVVDSIESYLTRKEPQLQPIMTQTAI
jgi:hypothetical protein